MKNIPKKRAENVFKTSIYRGSLYFPDAIAWRLRIIVLMQLIEGPNLSIFRAIAAAPMSDSTLFFFSRMVLRWAMISSYCSAYLVARKRQKYCTRRHSWIRWGVLFPFRRLKLNTESMISDCSWNCLWLCPCKYLYFIIKMTSTPTNNSFRKRSQSPSLFHYPSPVYPHRPISQLYN